MKKAIAVLIPAIALLAHLTMALGAWAQPAAPVQPYKLAPGDTLAVLVANEPDLSGKFVVGSTGEIAIPMLAPIKVQDLTIGECHEAVRRALSETLLKHPVVSVTVDTFRPVSVLGDVRTPGVYAYLPGRIAKTMIAHAGGYGLLELSANPSELLLAAERADTLATHHDRLLIRQARLEAQIAGATSFTPPKTQHIPPETARRLIREETGHIETQARTRAAQIELLEVQRPPLASEVVSIEGQIEAESQQVALLRGRLSEFEKLEHKGLSRSSNVIELRISLAAKEGNIWALKAQQTRTSIASSELNNKINELINQYNTRWISELDEIRRQILETEVTLPSARKILARRTQSASRVATGISPYVISIIRTTARERTEFEATELTLIEPGDVIEVRALPPGSLGSSSRTSSQ